MTDRRTFIKGSLIGIPILATGIEANDQSPERTTKPIVVSTWDTGITANSFAWKVLEKGGKAIDAVEQAARSVESEASCCVGLDGFPDRDGFVTLDASIMDHMANCGSVSYLQNVKHPISVARRLMETTKHVMLAGDGALQFAVENGFEKMPSSLSTDAEKAWKEWLKDSEYKPIKNIENKKSSIRNDDHAPAKFANGAVNHDTMGTIAIDATSNLSGACTTSGMAFKMHGRVGDSPIIGAGLFVDNEVGAATSSGVGEEVIRICGTHTIIEQMRFGRSPKAACREAVMRIVKRDRAKAKELQVGFIAISKRGEIGAFSVSMGFTYAVNNREFPRGKVFEAESYFKR